MYMYVRVSVGAIYNGQAWVLYVTCTSSYQALHKAMAGYGYCCSPVLIHLQVLAVFDEIHVNRLLHVLVFGESLLNGMWGTGLVCICRTDVRACTCTFTVPRKLF